MKLSVCPKQGKQKSPPQPLIFIFLFFLEWITATKSKLIFLSVVVKCCSYQLLIMDPISHKAADNVRAGNILSLWMYISTYVHQNYRCLTSMSDNLQRVPWYANCPMQFWAIVVDMQWEASSALYYCNIGQNVCSMSVGGSWVQQLNTVIVSLAERYIPEGWKKSANWWMPTDVCLADAGKNAPSDRQISLCHNMTCRWVMPLKIKIFPGLVLHCSHELPTCLTHSWGLYLYIVHLLRGAYIY